MARARWQLGGAEGPRADRRRGGASGPALQPALRAQTLGATVLLVGGMRLDPSAGTIFAILLRVVYSPGYSVARDVLLRNLWPGQAEARSRASLRQALYKLRGTGLQVGLDGEVVSLDPSQVTPVLATHRTHERFEQDVTCGHEPFGLFLPGYATGRAEYDEWLTDLRERVHADVRRVLVEQLRTRRGRADWMGADALARWLLQFDPLNEEATITRAECTALNGSKAEAVAILDRFLAELGPDAGDLRLQATIARRRISEPPGKQRVSFAPTERHFIGREELMAALTLSMRRAKWHDGSATLLHGPPGMGKTRVTQELSKVAVIEGFRVVSVSCRESDQQRPLSVFLDLVPELLEMPGAMGCAPESMQVLRRLAPAISDVSSGNREQDVDPMIGDEPHLLPMRLPINASLRRAVIDIAIAIADEKPMLLVLEDLHWLDAQSCDVVADLVERTRSSRIFVLATSRKPFVGSTRPERSSGDLGPRPLPPLHPEQSLALAGALAADHDVSLDDEVAKWMTDSCEGNPLFLRSLLQYWVETGDSGGLPPTLAQLFDHRLASLGPIALQILQVAGLLGRFSNIRLIGHVLDVPSHQLLEGIVELERVGALVPASPPLVTAHELILRAANSSLSPIVRSALHQNIAVALERQFETDQDPDILPSAGVHWRSAGDSYGLPRFVLRFAKELATVGSPAPALAVLDEAICINPSLARLPIVAQSRLHLQCAAGEYESALALHPGEPRLPQLDEHLSNDLAEEAVRLADVAYRVDPFIDREKLCMFLAGVSSLAQIDARVRLLSAETGLIIAANIASKLLGDACYLGIAPLRAGRLTDVCFRTLDLLYHTTFGDIEQAGHLAESLEADAARYEASVHTYSTYARVGFAYRVVGRRTDAIRALTKALETAAALTTPHHSQYCAWQLSQIHLEVGDIDSAEKWARLLRAYRADATDAFAQNFSAAHLCRLAIERSDVSEAEEELRAYAATAPRIPSLKAAAYHVALSGGVKLLDRDWRPEAEFLEVALDRHSRTAAYSTSDYLTSVVVRCLHRAGRAEEGRDLVKRYLTCMRRERGPIAVALERSIAAVDHL